MENERLTKETRIDRKKERRNKHKDINVCKYNTLLNRQMDIKKGIQTQAKINTLRGSE